MLTFRQGNDGWTTVIIASQIAIHKRLLSKQADVNIQNSDGFTALMVASHNGHLQVAELLLSR